MAVKRHNVHFDVTANDASASALRAVEGNLKRVNGAAEQLQRTFSSALVATALITLTRESARAAMEAEQAQARLTAVLRATGNQAGLTRREMDDLAESMADATQFDDESLREAMGTMLKFGNIQGDVLREGLKLSADLAAFMGTNVPEAAQMIGKSLQSPTEGLTMMERQFGKLTGAQKDHIETLVRDGRAIEAQNAVLELWRGKIGGVAGEMNTGLKQATSGVSKAWNEMLEAMGKTEIIGGTVRKSLIGVRDILRDIQAIGEKKDPLTEQMEGLAKANEVIEGLERTLAERRRQRRAYAGRDVDDPEDKQLEARIAFLRAERERLANQVRVLNTAGDPSTFDSRDRRLRAPGQITLGGDDDKGAAAREQREAEFRAQKAVELEEMAAQDKAEAWSFFHKQRDAQIEHTAQVERDRIKAIIDMYDREQEAAIEAGQAYLDAEAARKDALRETEDAARQLGLTMTSAFEDAVLEGEKARDVVRALGKDMARILLRKTVTEPLAGGLAAYIQQGLVAWGMSGEGPEQLGGPRAAGGPVGRGGLYLVGEEGPELFRPGSDGTIIPNDELPQLRGGGTTVVIHQQNSFHGDLRMAARAEISAMLPQIAEASKNATFDAMQRGQRP